jgi:hypothetical protein
VVEGADLGVTFEFYFKGEEAETEVTDEEAVKVVVVDGVGAEVPGISGVFAELQSEDGFELGDFLMGLKFGVVHAVVGVFVGVGGLLLMCG